MHGCRVTMRTKRTRGIQIKLKSMKKYTWSPLHMIGMRVIGRRMHA